MSDCRAVSNNLMNELVNGGFSEFVNLVRESEKLSLEDRLILCFRGNSNPQNVVIYYKNHMVWKLSISRQKLLSVTISFNHARYSKDWKEKLNILKNIYNFNGSSGYLKATSNYFNKDFVNGTFCILKNIIEDFFNTDLQYDYFKNKAVKHKDYLEKKKQHELYLKYNNCNDGLFIYDLEFAQKKAKYIDNNKNQPDMLGIRFANGVPKSLVLLEVKSKSSAMTNPKSGFNKHLEGMENYINNTTLMSNRFVEAQKIINQYKDLRLRNVNRYVNFNSLPVEIRFILTDEALDYFINSKNREKNSVNKLLNDKHYSIEHSNGAIEVYKEFKK